MDGSEFQSRLGQEIVFSFPNRQARLSVPASSLFSEYRSYFPGIEQQWREADHSVPSSIEGKSEWTCASTPPYVLEWRVNGQRYL